MFASFCVDTAVSYPDRLTLNFERGTVFRNAAPGAGRDRIELELAAVGPGGRAVFDEASGFDPANCGGHTSYQWENFIAAIRGRPVPDALPAEHIVEGVRIIAAMARSEQSGVPEQVWAGKSREPAAVPT